MAVHETDDFPTAKPDDGIGGNEDDGPGKQQQLVEAIALDIENKF
jgi:hypothetical protein